MKLKFINGPYGYARNVKALEIFENAVNNAEWLDEKDSLASGDMVGFNFGDDEVRATVEIGKEIIEVHIISPLKYNYARSLHMSFFSRNNWLKDENKVKAIVHRILTELYYDYSMVKLRKDDLVDHSRGYKSFRESFLKQERERTLEARKECGHGLKDKRTTETGFQSRKIHREGVRRLAGTHPRKNRTSSCRIEVQESDPSILQGISGPVPVCIVSRIDHKAFHQ